VLGVLGVLVCWVCWILCRHPVNWCAWCAGSTDYFAAFPSTDVLAVPGVLGVEATSPLPSIGVPDVPGVHDTPACPAQKALTDFHHDRKWTRRLSDFLAGLADQSM